ncbi:MAG TPA: glycosyltransferase [Pyrinomonadaceae bacterium]|nr:glycosyltransferase [Pyrinomonadaceae bacterium]
MSDELKTGIQESRAGTAGGDSASRAATRRSSLVTHHSAPVSVVVPSHNHAPFVERTLRSIFRQTRAPRELLVIDDGSRDGSAGVIERALRDCPVPCELVARENRGLCATLNEGLARTSGEYFAYLGSDDVWLPDFLLARVALLGARPRAALAYGNAYSIDAQDRIIDSTADWARYVDGDARRMLMGTLAPLSPTVLYRRAALEGRGWNESARLEDYELYLRLAAGGEFAFDPRVLSAWRVHGRNASGDLEMMLSERLAAQAAAGPGLGFSEAELRRFAARARFRSAEEFIRRGRKRRAAGLVLGGLGGVPSPAAAARTLLKFLTPHALIERRRRRGRERAFARYGRLPGA